MIIKLMKIVEKRTIEMKVVDLKNMQLIVT